MAIDILACKKQMDSGKAKIVRLSQSLAMLVYANYDPGSGDRLKDSTEPIEIEALEKQRADLQARGKVVEELLDLLDKQEIAAGAGSLVDR